jgi:CRP-like cAMP-binding protein
MSQQALEVRGVSARISPPGRPQASFTSSQAGLFEMMGASIAYSRNEEIYGEGESAEYLYKVKFGCVRTYKVLNDGRRQIGSFYLPGDTFGLEAGQEHTSSAEASVASEVIIVKRSILNSRASGDSTLARRLLDLTVVELQRAQNHVLLLIKSAQERVAAFLLDLAKREDSGNEIQVPMSRQEIADYLGLTIETVSRTLTQLENASAIALPTSRRIVLRNRAALARLNG